MNTKYFRHGGLVLALLAFAALPGHAQQPAAKSASGLTGIWQLQGTGVGGGNTVLAKRPQTQWSTTELPFTAEGLKAFNANKPGKGPRGIKPALGNDPLGNANPPGLYRTLVYGRPFEFAQADNKLLQVFEWGKSWRAIYTDGRPVPADVPAGPYWYGYSVGKWEGNTLVVTTLGLDNRAWIDEWGTSIGPDARIEERWTRVAPDRIEMTIKVTDPAYFARPWTSSPITYTLQKKGVEPEEIIFAPIDESAFNQDIRDPAGLPK